MLLSFRAIYTSVQIYIKLKNYGRQRARVMRASPQAITNDGSPASPQDDGRAEKIATTRSARWVGSPVTWQEISCRDKLKFFDMWFVMTLVATSFVITVSSFNMFHFVGDMGTMQWHKLMTGMGCALLWINVLRYFKHNANYFVLIRTLQRGVPKVGRFLVGVIPVFLAYAIFGVVYFGNYTERFGSITDSMITLFAVLNGDVIRETYLDIDVIQPFVGQVYMYTFICLFIYVVLNIFIAIIEEAFLSTQAESTKKSKKSGSGDGGGGGGGGSGHTAHRLAAGGGGETKSQDVPVLGDAVTAVPTQGDAKDWNAFKELLHVVRNKLCIHVWGMCPFHHPFAVLPPCRHATLPPYHLAILPSCRLACHPPPIHIHIHIQFLSFYAHFSSSPSLSSSPSSFSFLNPHPYPLVRDG